MARSGDTKPLCHVAQMIVALSGMSLWPLSGGKSLLLCPRLSLHRGRRVLTTLCRAPVTFSYAAHSTSTLPTPMHISPMCSPPLVRSHRQWGSCL
jgi:hypothetical protein